MDAGPTLAVAIGFSFAEIDSDIVVDLPNSNEEYAALSEQMSVMRKQHPFILNLDEGDGAITLSAEEHEAYLAYIGLMHQTEDRSTLTATGFIGVVFLSHSCHKPSPPINGIAPKRPCKYPLRMFSPFLGEKDASEYNSVAQDFSSFSANHI